MKWVKKTKEEIKKEEIKTMVVIIVLGIVLSIVGSIVGHIAKDLGLLFLSKMSEKYIGFIFIIALFLWLILLTFRIKETCAELRAEQERKRKKPWWKKS